MNRLTSWIKTVVVGYRGHLTDEQFAGDACAFCGREFFDTEDRRGWIGIPFRRRAWTCETSCIITAVDDVEALFRSAIPARQRVDFWSLGVMDVPLVSDYYGFDTVDKAYVAAVAAQPHHAVEIVHAEGVLTTRPLPWQYAVQIARQAQDLGFTALVPDLDEPAPDRSGHGPYDTRGQALADITPTTGRPDQAWRYARLTQAAEAAGAGLGEFDRLVLGWLAGWEADTVQVVIGLIGRAHAAGRNHLAAEMAELRARIDALETAARHGAPVETDFGRIRHGANGGPR